MIEEGKPLPFGFRCLGRRRQLQRQRPAARRRPPARRRTRASDFILRARPILFCAPWAGGRACYLEWYPYSKDRTMGLNHQMASLIVRARRGLSHWPHAAISGADLPICAPHRALGRCRRTG